MIEPFKVQVRFSDLDVLGHVTNSVYLSYFEAARVYYFKHLLNKEWNWSTDSVLVVKSEVEYVQPILLNDEPHVEIYTKHIGTKSFTFGYNIRVNNVVYSRGASTLVAFDIAKQRTVPIKPEMLEVLEKLKKEELD
jgi:acyl-CoA thioester hydrolase